MKTTHGLSPLFLSIIVVLALGAGCSETLAPPAEAPADPAALAVGDQEGAPARGNHATGEVVLLWNGNAASPGADSTRVAVVRFAVHEADARHPARGTFVFSVQDADGSVHREVTATADGVVVDPVEDRVWMTGVVTADSKGCGGGPGGGHDEGCTGDDGGCADEHDDGHDGGCAGDHEEGGCTDGGHDDGGMGGGPGATGRTCRVGQAIALKAHDAGSPGALADGITWKWFLADSANRPSIDDLAAWPHLCRKTITGGNLVVHAAPGRPVAPSDGGE